MARIKLPAEILPEQIDALFLYFIKLSAKRERAVRLRLAGFTYKEIAEKISRDSEDGSKVNEMWVHRSCQRAKVKIEDVYKKRVKMLDDPIEEPDPVIRFFEMLRHDSLVKLLHQLQSSLKRGEHKVPRTIADGVVPIAPGMYPCPVCSSGEWTYRTVNTGGHKNYRIYVCSDCGIEYSAAERREFKKHIPS